MKLNQALLGSFRETVESVSDADELDDVVSEMPDKYADALSDTIEGRREELSGSEDNNELTETGLVAALDEDGDLRQAAEEYLNDNAESGDQAPEDSDSDSEEVDEGQENPDEGQEDSGEGESESDESSASDEEETPESGAEDSDEGSEEDEEVSDGEEENTDEKESGEAEETDEGGEQPENDGDGQEEAEDSISPEDAANALREADEIDDEAREDILQAVASDDHVVDDATIGTLKDSAETLGAEVGEDPSLSDLVTAIDEAARNPRVPTHVEKEEITTRDLLHRLNKHGKL